MMELEQERIEERQQWMESIASLREEVKELRTNQNNKVFIRFSHGLT